MRILKPGALYFGLVFGAGFALGTIRTLWMEPWAGARTAELTEMPVMLLVMVLAARRVARSFSLLPATATRLGVGCLALGLLLLAEFALVRWVRHLTISEYVASRDPVAGAAYLGMLLVFAAMPLLVARK